MGEVHSMYCTKCGNKGLSVCRTGQSKQKDIGHLKKMWCTYCKEQVNHAEISNNYTVEMFQFEFKQNNFIDGVRKIQAKSIVARYYKSLG